MKRNIIVSLAVAGFCFALISCNKEETYTFPDTDRDWLRVTDNPGNQADHAIYQFFEKWQIPIFFNDTIGQMECKDVWGRPYTYYEVLKIDFSVGSSSIDYEVQAVSNIKECSKDAYGKAAAEFLDEHVMPHIQAGNVIKSILMVDTLKSGVSNYVYKGFNTLVIGSASRIARMSQNERSQYKGAIITAFMYESIMDNAANKLIIQNEFRKVSEELNDPHPTAMYYWTIYDPQLTALYIIDPILGKGWYEDGVRLERPLDPQKDVGWLGWSPRSAGVTSETAKRTPSVEEDVLMFINEAFGCGSDAVFEAKWPPAQYDRMNRKYQITKKLIVNVGSSIPAS